MTYVRIVFPAPAVDTRIVSRLVHTFAHRVKHRTYSRSRVEVGHQKQKLISLAIRKWGSTIFGLWLAHGSEIARVSNPNPLCEYIQMKSPLGRNPHTCPMKPKKRLIQIQPIPKILSPSKPRSSSRLTCPLSSLMVHRRVRKRKPRHSISKPLL